MEELVEVLDLHNARQHKFISHLPVSGSTTEHCIRAISKHVENCLMCDLKNCREFS